MAAGVAELISYPVKGCAGVSAASTVLTAAGLAHDRTFLVIRPDGGFRSQRRDPRLAVVRPTVSQDGGLLRLEAPGIEPIAVQVDLTAPRREVELFGAGFTGIDQGEAAAQWFSHVLGAASRLVRVPPEHARVSDGLIPGTSAYADSCAVLVCSASSLAALNERIAGRGAEPVPMNRFRPNIVVDGWDEPHLEDTLRRAEIGDAAIGFAKLAIRCAVTMVDQVSGGKGGPEPLRTLAGYRRASEGGVAFGAKFAVLRPGSLSVGDEVLIHDHEVTRL